MKIRFDRFRVGHSGEGVVMQVNSSTGSLELDKLHRGRQGKNGKLAIPLEALPSMIEALQKIADEHLDGFDLSPGHVFFSLTNEDISAALDEARNEDFEFEGTTRLPVMLAPEQMREVHRIFADADGRRDEVVEAVRMVATHVRELQYVAGSVA